MAKNLATASVVAFLIMGTDPARADCTPGSPTGHFQGTAVSKEAGKLDISLDLRCVDQQYQGNSSHPSEPTSQRQEPMRVENCGNNYSGGPILFLCRRGSKGKSSMANSHPAVIPDPSTYVAPENRLRPAPCEVRCTSPLSSGTRTPKPLNLHKCFPTGGFLQHLHRTRPHDLPNLPAIYYQAHPIQHF